VSEPEKARHLVTNHRDQPVELHLPSGLVVLPPRGRAVVSEADLAARQLQVLRSGRLITTQEIAPEPRSESGPEPEPEREPAAAPPSVPEDATGGDVSKPQRRGKS
jgi:hypothetical protein